MSNQRPFPGNILPEPYLNPSEILVVMLERDEALIDDVRDSLDALAWIGQNLADAAAGARNVGGHDHPVQMPAAAFSALMRVMRDKLSTLGASPSIRRVLAARPDLLTERSAA
ncbi:MAG TPA: hypothetical protein PKD73_08065 [Burkholderiaceae bacterium]|nr:hypothetical protein [Burkholderiaceae bacterium]